MICLVELIECNVVVLGLDVVFEVVCCEVV